MEESQPSQTPLDNNQSTQNQGKWYVLHTYSGHENRVEATLRQRVEAMGIAHKIFDIVVPTKDTITIKRNKKEQIKEKFLPGYIIIKMILDDESWLVVRTTPGVTSFVGTGNRPTPISDEEVQAILKFTQLAQPTYKSTFSIGEAVKITAGPFADMMGSIESIDEAKGLLRVLVTIFGRETPVELDLLQVKKL